MATECRSRRMYSKRVFAIRAKFGLISVLRLTALMTPKLQYPFSDFHCQFIQGHRRECFTGIRNCTVWPILFLLNIFLALKGTYFYSFM